MFQEITSSEFSDWFLNSETYKNNFSYSVRKIQKASELEKNPILNICWIRVQPIPQ